MSISGNILALRALVPFSGHENRRRFNVGIKTATQAVQQIRALSSLFDVNLYEEGREDYGLDDSLSWTSTIDFVLPDVQNLKENELKTYARRIEKLTGLSHYSSKGLEGGYSYTWLLGPLMRVELYRDTNAFRDIELAAKINDAISEIKQITKNFRRNKDEITSVLNEMKLANQASPEIIERDWHGYNFRFNGRYRAKIVHNQAVKKAEEKISGVPEIGFFSYNIARILSSIKWKFKQKSKDGPVNIEAFNISNDVFAEIAQEISFTCPSINVYHECAGRASSRNDGWTSLNFSFRHDDCRYLTHDQMVKYRQRFENLTGVSRKTGEATNSFQIGPFRWLRNADKENDIFWSVANERDVQDCQRTIALIRKNIRQINTLVDEVKSENEQAKNEQMQDNSENLQAKSSCSDGRSWTQARGAQAPRAR